MESRQTVADIKARLAQADSGELAVLERALLSDTRKGVRDALCAARKRIEAEKQEEKRLGGLYAYERQLAHGRLIVGLDEVGRGPIAGPLAVGAVVLPKDPRIPGLDDSKKINERQREGIAARIKEHALAWAVVYIEAEAIDAAGMTASLRVAFTRAVRKVEEAGVVPEVLLIDGNPLHFDERELNVVKGDGRCASIAAASIVAKVDRDALMRRYAEQYPVYGFDSCKGYASAQHIEAIKEHGLSPLHRKSFCASFLQESLF